MTELSGSEFIRYSRQMMIKEHDEEAQTRLKNASVLVVGMGGLGCPVAQYLAAAGIGHLLIADADRVEATNLHRQILYSDADLGQQKVDAAASALKTINPYAQVTPIAQQLGQAELSRWVQEADCVLDCTDNIRSRHAINQAARTHKKGHIVGAAIRLEGQVISFNHADDTPGCYQCLVPEANEQAFSCSTAGVLGPVLGIVGGMQALAAIKYLAGYHFVSNLWQCFDGRQQNWIAISHGGDPQCSVCGQGR